MRSSIVRLCVALFLIGSFAALGCRDFSPTKPFPCSTSGHCPDGFTCQASSRLCYGNGQFPDGGSHDSADASDAEVHPDTPNTADGNTAESIDTQGRTEAASDVVIDAPMPDQNGDTTGTANGGVCVQGAECQSTFCFDHVCCDKACQGTCLGCKRTDTGQADGTCANVSTGKDPYDQCALTQADKCGDNGSCDGQGTCQKYGTNQVCASAACNGSIFTPAGTCNGSGACTPGTAVNCQQYQCTPTGGCAKTCTVDGDCLGQSFCNNGTCASQKTGGQACGDKRECTSGFCADGVCCDGSCNGLCESCLAASNGQADGRCLPVQAGKTSGTDCATSGGTCGQDGTCDGNRKCRVAARNTNCGSAACSGSNLTAGPLCDGAGTCIPAQTQSCPGSLVCASATSCKLTCSGDGDCVSQTYCNGQNCVPKKNNGDACGEVRECSSGFCADGICCMSACAGTCMACSTTLTGQTSGMCAAVKIGSSHGADCTATDPTTCGTDGKCDGKGACRFTASGTTCKGEACLPGTSSYSPMSTCDGKGTCAPMPQDCDKYKCTSDGVRCRTSCGSDGDCTAKAYCNGSTCTSDLTPGSVCARAEQCTTNLCGGRCCSGPALCKCPQPSSTNLIRNAGFDSDVSGWGTEGSFTRESPDSDGCPYSGSIRSAGYPDQCVPVIGGTSYNFGFSYQHTVSDDEGPISCAVIFRDDFVCAGNRLDTNPPTAGEFVNRGIIPWTSTQIVAAAPAGARSAEILCTLSGGSWYLDKIFLTPAPGTY